MHGASTCASAAMKGSSAEVSSIRRVKCVVIASSVAMLASRSCPRVFCKTDTRVSAEVDESGVE